MSLYGSYSPYNCRMYSVPYSDTTNPSMADEVSAAAPVKVPAKAPATAKEKGSGTRRRSTPARKTNKITMVKQILEVLAVFKQPKGVSVPAIKKELRAKGVDVDKQNHRVNLAIRRLEEKGEVVQVKGTGASGSFKLPRRESKKDTSKSKRKTDRTKSPSRKPAGKVSKKGTSSKEGKSKRTEAKKPAAKKPTARKPGARKPGAKKPAAKKPAPNKRAKPSPKMPGKATSNKQRKATQKKSATSKSTPVKAKK